MSLSLVTQSPEQKLHRDVLRRIEAAMETGNHEVARTTLREYIDINPQRGREIRTYLVGAYGTGLL